MSGAERTKDIEPDTKKYTVKDIGPNGWKLRTKASSSYPPFVILVVAGVCDAWAGRNY